MDLTPYLGTIVTVIITAASIYAAVSSRLTKTETLIADLRRDVEKHNQMVERTYKLEVEVDNLYHRYDELKHDVKIGGTE